MQIIQTANAPLPIGPYSQAVKLPNGLVVLSGQIGLRADGTMSSDDIVQQTQQIFANIQCILEEIGLGFQNVFKLTVFVQSIKDFERVNEVMMTILKPPYPTRALVEAAALPKNALVEVETWAFTPN